MPEDVPVPPVREAIGFQNWTPLRIRSVAIIAWETMQRFGRTSSSSVWKLQFAHQTFSDWKNGRPVFFPSTGLNDSLASLLWESCCVSFASHVLVIYSGQFESISASLSPKGSKGGSARGFLQNGLNSGLGIIQICPANCEAPPKVTTIDYFAMMLCISDCR